MSTKAATKSNSAVSQEIQGNDIHSHSHHSHKNGKCCPSDDEENEQALQESTTKSEAEASNALEKLTDVIEDKQLDENKMKQAFMDLQKQEEVDKEADRKREKELEAVKVKKEDIVFISREMEITSQQAERKLREADGDISKCLHTMLCA